MHSTSTTHPVYDPVGLASREEEAADHPVGPVVWERRPTIDVAEASDVREGFASARVFDVCRLLVALVGLGVYLSVPASVVFLVVKLAS